MKNTMTEQTMINKKKYKLTFFIVIVFLTTWIPWIIASQVTEGVDSVVYKILIATGGIAPTLTALIVLFKYHSKEFRKNYWSRVFSFKFFKYRSSWLILLPLLYAPTAILISIFFFNGSWNQFHLTVSLLGFLPFMIFTLFFGPVPEELGWRGYLLDAIHERKSLLKSAIFMGIIWAVWHIPLFFIPGYPLQERSSSLLFLFVYFIDIFLISIIMTYIYYKTDRIILTAILFHFVSNFIGTIIEMETNTESIQLILLVVICCILILKRNKEFLKNEIHP